MCAPFGGVFRGNAPESLVATSETPLSFKNGEGGEECESIPRRDEQDRPSLLQLQQKLSSKTFLWNVLDVLYLYHQTKAAASLLLRTPSLAGRSSFAADSPQNSTLRSAFKARLRTQAGISLSAESANGALPP